MEKRLIYNSIITPDGTVLVSRHRHDYNSHLDKNGLTYSIDGGTDYTRTSVGFTPVYLGLSIQEIKYIKSKGIYYDYESGRFKNNLQEFIDTSFDKYGYRCIKINNKTYKAHRLAHMFVGIDLLDFEVDHINNIRGDNRWENLRLVSRGENQANSLIRVDSTSGVKGLSYHKTKRMWVGRVQHDRVRYEVSSRDRDTSIKKLNELRDKLHGVYSNKGYNELLEVKNIHAESFCIYDDEPHETLRMYIERGSRGKDGDEPLRYIKLKDIDDDYLKAIIDYEEELRPDNPYLRHYKNEKKFRK